MILHDILESIKLFIILNPWECIVTCALIFTFFGMYIEDVFKIWNWGPKCNRCKEWTFWSTSVSHCNDCFQKELNSIADIAKYGEDLT